VGVVVTKVEPRSPADAAGIVVGDRILSLGGQAVTGESQFLRLVQSAPGQTRMRLVRGGDSEPIEVDVDLDGEPVHMGISWRDDPAEPSAVYLTRVVPGSLAAAAGLRVLDRIYSLDGTAVGGTDSFAQMLDERLKNGEPFMLEVERFGRLSDVEVGRDE
jgi:S1-C subfamily serine protease